MITVGSCFAGIGGIELGLESTGGFKTVWQIENDPYAIGVLKKHWPHVLRHGDIKAVDPTSLEAVDLVCGGYPCQPFSLAGKRSGENDPRHLWPDMFRIVRALRPRLILLENVPGHLSMGCGRVLADLSEGGYDAEWGLLSAAGVGAPHLRKRLFIVAHAASEQAWVSGQPWKRAGMGKIPSYAKSGRRRQEHSNGGGASEGTIAAKERGGLTNGDRWPATPGVCRMDARIPNSVDRIRCLGNAVVPQVAAKVGRMILEAIDAARI